jgi:hypothetical protein
MTRLIAIFCVLLSVVGCANTVQQPVDLTNTQYISNKEPLFIKKIVIENKVQDKKNDVKFFDDSLIRINYLPKPKDVVEQDLKNLFEQRSIKNNNKGRDVVVTIEDASAYWVYGTANKIPLINILAVASDQNYVFKVQILFEVEEAGKVISSYRIDETVKISVAGAGLTVEAEKLAYASLIKTYRNQVLKKIDDNFMSRYF